MFRLCTTIPAGCHRLFLRLFRHEIASRAISAASFLLLLLLHYRAAFAEGSAFAEKEKPTRRPNIIVIFTDDQGYSDLGCFGSKSIKTPHIDRMATEGMKLTSFYVTCPFCSPSRAALLTGCYHKRVSVNKVLFPGEAIGLNPDETTIAEMLKPLGYSTACVGKWHLGDQKRFLPTRQGFEEFFGLPFSNDMNAHRKGRHYPPLPLLCGEKVIEGEPNQDNLTKRYTEYAVDFIERKKDQPFFLYLSHSMPHRPCHASASYMKRFTRDQIARIDPTDKSSSDFVYPASIEEIDWSVGEILKTLKRLDIDQHTLVLFTSDNGPAVGSAGPLRGGKGSSWEGGMRVPAVVRWPGHIPGGKTCDAILSTIDVLPAIARLTRAKLPEQTLDGKDIWPLLAGMPGAKSPHDYYLYYRGSVLESVRQGAWKLYAPKRAKNTKGPLLYNLETDIGETTDLSKQHPQIVQRLSKILEDARVELGDGPDAGKQMRPTGRVENPKTLTTHPKAQKVSKTNSALTFYDDGPKRPDGQS